MISTLMSSFAVSLAAMTKVAIVIFASAYLVRRKVFNESHIRALAGVVVNLALPCLIFESIITDFDTVSYPHWWKYPLLGGLLTLGGLAIARLMFFREGEKGNTLTALASFQNAGYLILPVGEVLFPDQFERFSVILFLMLLSYMLLLWSVGKFYISHRVGTKLRLSQLFTVPFYAAVLAMLLVFTGLDRFVPELFLGSVDLVGKSCVPLATVVLGFTMGLLKVEKLPSFADTGRVVLVKLLIMPLLVLLALKYTNVSSGPLEDAFWILQASAPPATGTALQAIHFGGDEKLVCGVLLFCYPAALLLMPFFFSMVQVLIN